MVVRKLIRLKGSKETEEEYKKRMATPPPEEEVKRVETERERDKKKQPTTYLTKSAFEAKRAGDASMKNVTYEMYQASAKAPMPTSTTTVSKDVRPTIKLTPKKEEKTGISKLREEDSIIGAAIKVATDWRTTVALVGTLATVASLGGLVAAGVGARAGAGVITHTVTAKGLTQVAQRGIVGKPVVSAISKIFNAGGRTITRGIPLASNPKTHALTTSMLKKAGMLAGVAGGMAGSLFLGQWAQAEAPEGLTIALRDALKQAQQTGDWSIYNDAREIVDEITDLNVWEKIALWTPFAPFIGIPNKMKGVIEGAKLLDKIAERAQQKQKEEEGEPTFAEQREQSGIEARERELIERKEDEKYYKRIAKERQERELREREEESAYYKKIEEEKTTAKLKEREEDEEYWDDIYRKKEERKSGEKTTPYTYWKKKKKEKTNEPWNEEDKKIVDDWNAGKSALNFKWLGL